MIDQKPMKTKVSISLDENIVEKLKALAEKVAELLALFRAKLSSFHLSLEGRPRNSDYFSHVSGGHVVKSLLSHEVWKHSRTPFLRFAFRQLDHSITAHRQLVKGLDKKS